MDKNLETYKWVVFFHIEMDGDEYLADLVYGPFFSEEKSVIWRDRFLERLGALEPLFSLRFAININFQRIGRCSVVEFLNIPYDPDEAAEDFFGDYIFGTA
jgi:hypothetical protein